jgi:hypothetical protein
MAISFVQNLALYSTPGRGGTTSHSAPLSATPTSGNLMIAHLNAYPTSSITITATGWTEISFTQSSHSLIQFLYRISDGTETSLDFTTSGNVQYVKNVNEFSGVDTSSPIASSSLVHDIEPSPNPARSTWSTGTHASTPDTAALVRFLATSNGGFVTTSAPTGHVSLGYIEGLVIASWALQESPYTAGDNGTSVSVDTEFPRREISTLNIGLREAGGSSAGSALSAAHLANAIRLQSNYKR